MLTYAIGTFAGLSLAFLMYALWYRGNDRLTYGVTGELLSNPTRLPGFVDRSIGNLTRWRLVSRVSGFEDGAATRAIQGSGNPWEITLVQYYALVVLSSLAFGLGFGFLAAGGASLIGVSSGSFGAVPIVAIIAFVLGAFTGSRLPLSLLRSKVNKRQRDVLLHLHEALDLFSMGTTTGASMPQAMELTYHYLLEGHLREEVGRVCDDLANAVPFKEAVEGLYTRNPSKRMLTFVRMLKDANSDGKDRTDRLRREAAEMREDQQRLMEKRAGLVQMVFIGAIIAGLLPLMLLPFIVPFAGQLTSGLGIL